MPFGKAKTAIRVFRERGIGSVFNLIRHNLGLAKSANESQIIFDFFKAQGFVGTMVDVGAHCGHALLSFASEGWNIFAFEPDPDNRAHLVQLASKYNSLKVDERAVSDQPAKQVAFYSSDESDGVSGLQAFLPSHESKHLVDVTTLRDFVEEKGINHIDFLKIDTEGFDLMVLKGTPWEKLKPRLILCEFEDSITLPLGYNYHDMAQYLIENGYQILVSEWKPIRRYGEKHDWRGFYAYPHELHTPKAWGNLIATRDSHDFKKLSAFLKI